MNPHIVDSGTAGDYPTELGAVGRRRSRTTLLGRAADAVAADPVLVALLVAGLVLRTVNYFFDRALWFDEALLTLNILGKPWHALTGPLDYLQGAPVGFLAAEKGLAKLFGTSEYVLRLVPFVAGLAAVPLFAWLARRLLSRPAAAFALALFVLMNSLTTYTAEVKQYSVDVAVVLALLATAVAVSARPRLTTCTITGLAALGAVGLWFSHPSLFVLAAVGVGLLADAASRRDWRRARQYALVCGAWAVSFGIEYVFALRGIRLLQVAWRRDPAHVYGPLPPRSLSDAAWYVKALGHIFVDGANLGLAPPLAAVAAVLAAAGVVSLYRKSRLTLSFLVLPIAFALLASGLEKFPWVGRFRLFLVPPVLLLVAAGIGEAAVAARRLGRFGYALPLVLAAIVLVPVVRQELPLFTDPAAPEDIKPALAYLRSHWRSTDQLYLFGNAQYAFRYYMEYRDQDRAPGGTRRLWPLVKEGAPAFDTPALASRPPSLVVGSMDGTHTTYARGVRGLRSGRVWLLFSHARPSDVGFILSSLRRLGAERVSVRAPGVVLVFYDVRRKSA